MAKKSTHELIKVIGLEPHKLFEKIPKYKVRIDKMPKFSDTFEPLDNIIPGFTNLQTKSSIPGQQIMNPLSSHMQFQRIDGRQVISLQFNPYFISNDPEKKTLYKNYMHQIL